MITNITTLRAIARLLAPWRTIRRLEHENQRLTDALSNPLLTGIDIGRERGIKVGMRGSGPQLLAGMFLGMLEQDGKNAPNYLEITFESPKGPIVVTVMQPNGSTPHQLRQQAEQRVRQFEDELQRLQSDNDQCQLRPRPTHRELSELFNDYAQQISYSRALTDLAKTTTRLAIMTEGNFIVAVEKLLAGRVQA